MDRDDLAGAGRALFGLVRVWSRRWIAGPRTPGDRRIQAIAAAEAVDAQAARGAGPVTVNDVAHRLGLDQSNASRLVAQAVEDGVLARARSDRDRRATALSLTPAGEALLADARRHQDAVFRDLVAAWDPAERARLARYLRALESGTPPAPD